MNERGFLLLEALLTILILSIAFTVCIGAVAQALHLSKRSEDQARLITEAESALFQMEIGESVDYLNGNVKFFDTEVYFPEKIIP